VREVELDCQLPDEEVDVLEGAIIDDSYYDPDLLVTEDTTVRKPDGTVLLVLKKNCLSHRACQDAYPHLYEMANKEVAGGNRGTAAGVRMVIETLEDGTIGKRNRVPKLYQLSDEDRERLRGAYNGVAGSLDRNPDVPYCRQTEYGPTHENIRPCLPFIQAVDKAFSTYAPDRWKAQSKRAADTHKVYLFKDTCFTSLTINRNWQTATHKDEGDLKEGFGVMACMGSGYEGGYLVFPKYRVAVDYRTGDVLLADVHEWHANTAIVGQEREYERLSCVFYFRERMYKCLSPEDELIQAKHRQPGDLLY